jgi:hypothetical protein
MQVMTAVVEEAFRPPLARLASQNFASGADVAEVFRADEDKARGASAGDSEPGVEIIKPAQLPAAVEVALKVGIQLLLSVLLAPVQKCVQVFSTQPELLARGTLTKPYVGLGQVFFSLGASEGFWSLFRGGFVSSAAHLLHGAVRRSAAAQLGRVVAKSSSDTPVRVVALHCASDVVAVSAVYGLFSVQTRLATDFATESRPRLYAGPADVVRSVGVKGLYKGLGWALAASCLRDVAILLRVAKFKRAGPGFRALGLLANAASLGLIFGVIPFFELAVSRRCLGGLEGLGVWATFEAVTRGPWTWVSLWTRL